MPELIDTHIIYCTKCSKASFIDKKESSKAKETYYRVTCFCGFKYGVLIINDSKKEIEHDQERR